MKRIASFVLMCMMLVSSSALASDHPFDAGIDYSVKYRDFGAVSSMLNFGCAKLAVGEDLYEAPRITLEKETTEQVEKYLSEGYLFYNYLKWQYRDGFYHNRIDAMLVMTDPMGRYYATYGEWEQGASRRGATYSWFLNVTDCLRRCRDENNGSLPKGEYIFTVFLNQKNFRIRRIQLI